MYFAVEVVIITRLTFRSRYLAERKLDQVTRRNDQSGDPLASRLCLEPLPLTLAALETKDCGACLIEIDHFTSAPLYNAITVCYTCGGWASVLIAMNKSKDIKVAKAPRGTYLISAELGPSRTIIVVYCTKQNCKMYALSVVPALVGLAAATITITDPSDIVGVAAWESDNAILADYSPNPVCYIIEAKQRTNANDMADYLPHSSIPFHQHVH